jgi:signal transduction histidine kinase
MGQEIPCEVRLVRLPGEGKPYLRGSITNIADRKAARDAIVTGDRLKSEFLANMSHELRTPLNSIVGYTDVLLMGIDGDLNDEMKLDVAAIQENSQTLLHIINDILDLAKIEAGRMTFELSELDIHALMEDVIRNSAGLVVNKSVEFMLDVEKKLPAITADEGRVTQILNNLVSNATKFTEEGSITLKAFAEGSEWVVMQVADTGIGMNEEDLQVIFDEFTQADSSQTRTVEGTGLGLTITRRLVQMHGGEISVESEQGKGSTFTVKLPVATRISSDVTVKLASSNGTDAKANGTKGKAPAKASKNNK